MKVLTALAAVAAGFVLTSCGGGGEMSPPQPAADAASAPMSTEPAASEPSAPTAAVPSTNNDSLLADSHWAVLFGGHDLTSFDQIGGADWQLADGVVSADSGEPGFLVTHGAYSNFTIEVEFQASPATNSGVFIRCADPNDVSSQHCYEINIYDQNQNPANLTGAIVGVAAPATSVQAGDQWNTLSITAEGTHLTVRFNGAVTADVEDDTHDAGYIGLQYNAGPIKFREVRIRPL